MSDKEQGTEEQRRDSLVNELVSHHKTRDSNTKLATGVRNGCVIALLEPIDVVQGQYDDRLADLGRLEQFLHELNEDGGDGELKQSRLGIRMWDKGRGRRDIMRRRRGRRSKLGEPEIADHFTSLFGEELRRYV